MRVLVVLFVVFVIGLAAVIFYADHRWRRDTIWSIDHLGIESHADTVSFARLDSLPAPVARYFRAVLRDGQPVVRRARLAQRGEFLVTPSRGGWRPFDASQHFAARPAGFVWDARVHVLPGVTVFVRDQFLQGRGAMRGSVMALYSFMDMGGNADLSTAALQRWLAEAVWLPTALLPSQGVTWTAIDDSTARASVASGTVTAALDYHFGADSLVHRVDSPARARAVGDRFVPTPWQGAWLAYEARDGMRIPVAGEVEWLLPGGPLPYWRGTVTDASYEYAR